MGVKETPPFVMRGDDGAWTGLSVELWQRIAADLRIRYEFQEYDLAGLLNAVEDGEIDVAVAALSVTPERERVLDFTHGYHHAGLGIAVKRFYDGHLSAHESVASHTLAGLEPSALEIVRVETAFEFLDTAGAGHEEAAPEHGASRSNPGEAELVERVVEDLLAGGLRPGQIGVITPYAAHAALLAGRLQTRLDQGLEIDSVDGFQGREKEAIILSTVRSNHDAVIGFLADPRRLNVSITRARRKLVVIGDSATLGSDALWNAFIEHAATLNAHRSVFELA